MAEPDADGVLVPSFFYVLNAPGEHWPTDDWAEEAGRDTVYGINEPGGGYDLQPLLDGMEDWTYVHVRLDPAQQHRFFCDVSVPDADLAALPDIRRVCSMCFVSRRAREIIDEHDPEGAIWIPVTLRGRPSGQAAVKDHAVLLPRRSFHHNQRETDRRPAVDFHPVFPELYADLQYNPATRAFFGDIALWFANGWCHAPHFSEALFRALKRAGVTGIEERTGPYQLDWQGGSIAHVLHEPPRGELEGKW